MEKFIARYFTSWYYFEFKNKKLFHIESAFVYMFIACMILAYGIFANSTLILILCLIPFLFGGSVMWNGSSIPYWVAKDKETGKWKIKHFKFSYYPFVTMATLGKMGAWRTQLKLIKAKVANNIEITNEEFALMGILEKVWEDTYGEKYHESPYVKIVKFVPWLLFVGGIIMGLIFGN